MILKERVLEREEVKGKDNSAEQRTGEMKGSRRTKAMTVFPTRTYW